MEYKNHVGKEVEDSSLLEHSNLGSTIQVATCKFLEMSLPKPSKEQPCQLEVKPAQSEGYKCNGQAVLQEIRLGSSKENVDMMTGEKEQKIILLEEELEKMRQYVACIQNERCEAKKAKESSDRKVSEIQVELGAVESALKKLAADNQVKCEAYEKQQLDLNEALQKLELQNRFLESGSIEANQAKDSIELQRSIEDLKQQLAEKDGLVRNLRNAHEQLRLSFKKKEGDLQREKEEVITALESSELKFEEQRVKLVELENDLTRAKGQTANLDKRCATAERNASETSSLVAELQSKLDCTTMELVELTDANAQVDTMKMQLQEMERALSQATAQKAFAESSLRELKPREEHLAAIEQSHKDLQERLKWRNEQFQSLEEAHAKLQTQLKEKRIWQDGADLKLREERLAEVERGYKDLEDRLKWRNEQFQSLEEAHSKLKAQFKEKSSEWNAERAGMLSEIDSLHLSFDSKDQLVEELQNQLQIAQQAVESQRTLQKLKDQIEDLESALWQKDAVIKSKTDKVCLLEKRLKENSEIQCNMEKHIAVLTSQVCKAVEDLKMLEDTRTILDEELRKSREELALTKTDLERKLQIVQKDWSSSCMRLKAATQELDESIAQNELLLKDLDLKESTMTDLTKEKKSLLIEKEVLQQVVQVLEIKKVELTQEVESGKNATNQLCNLYEDAQSRLASSYKEIEDLQAKLQNAHKVGAQLIEAEEKIKDLEGYLKAAKSIAHDHEEKLSASEWAVQQLAIEVGRAKTALTQKDREEGRLRDELADLERQFREKEGSLIEMECYLEDASMARELMEGQVCQLRQQMDDLSRGAAEWKRKELELTSQLEVVGAALEEKREALVTSELEVKRANNLRDVMEGAIQSLKLQVAHEQRTLLDRQEDMDRLCEDLERSKSLANSSAEVVKELQGRLQQLEQSSEDHIKQFESALSELKDELGVAHSQLEKDSNVMKSIAEESSQYKEKCEALLDLNGRKDCALKDVEAQLLNSQASALDQSHTLEQRDQELQFAKEKFEHQREKQISLEESLSRVQSQRSELQQENDELTVKLRKLNDHLDALSTEYALKLSQYEEKCGALFDLLGRRDCTLKDLEDQLVTVQASALEQSHKLEQRDYSLQCANEQLQHHHEEQISLQEGLSTIEKQKSQLQLANEELERRLGRLTGQLDSLSTESFLKSKDIEDFKTQVWQMKAVVAQQEENKVLIARLEDELRCSSQVTRDHEARRHVLEESFQGTQRELQVLQVALADKETDMVSLLEKLSKAEKQYEDSEAELAKLRDALTLAQSDLTEKSEVLSSYLSKMNVLEVDNAEWREMTEASTKEVSSLKQELHAATCRAVESEKQVSKLQETLKGVQLDLKTNKEKLLLQIASVEELEGVLKEWKAKSAAAMDENQVLTSSLEAAKVRDLEKDTMIGKLQEVLKNTDCDMSKYVLLVKTLQAELAELRVKELAGSEEIRTLRQHLEVALKKAELNQQNISELQKVQQRTSYELQEKRNQNSVYISSFNNLQEELLEWKAKLSDAEREVSSLQLQLEDADCRGLEHQKEYVQIKESMIMLEHALIEERGKVQHLTNVDLDLIEERKKASESASLINNLQAEVQGWKTKASDAKQDGEIVKQGLEHTINGLVLEIEAHKEKERTLEELNCRLQVDLTAAQEEALARKEKMQSFLHQLELSQSHEKDLLQHLQMEHKRLIAEMEDGGGFDCTFATDLSHDLQGLSKGVKDIAAVRILKSDITNRAMGEHLLLEESQDSAVDCSLEIVNEALEKELVILRHQASEAQNEAHQLAGKLEAALSNVSTKNLIIKQVNEEITGLRSQVKRLEQETLLLYDNIHGEAQQILTDRTIWKNGKEDGQENAALGKRKAESQEELNQYLELCDSLVRKNIRLEKQLDGLQRKNRGLQKQVEGLQLLVKTSSDKERRALDPVDCSPEQVARGFTRKSNQNNKPQDRRIFPLQDISKGKILAEIDENSVPGSLDRSQVSRRPPGSPAAVHHKKARRFTDEV